LSAPSWEEKMRELRQAFVHEGHLRVDEMDHLLSLLTADRADRKTFYELMRAFHSFTGSGATHGFPQITAIARIAEEECTARLREGTTPSATDIAAWRRHLADLRSELVSTTEPSYPPVSPASPGPARVAEPDILLVDDDPTTLETLRRCVEQEGLTSRCALSHAEALVAMDKAMPQGLIVDVVLPDGSGYDLVERFRERPGGEDPPVLVISVKSGFLDKVEATHCGADGYFQKPVDWEALMRRLVYLLDRNQRQGSRVLSVEDDPVQANFVRTILEAAGYTVRVCADPRLFESDLTSFRPDLVLMDVVLPGMNGYDLARFVRQYDRYAALPIVFLTTEAQMEAKMRAAVAGADDYLQKPVVPELLLTSIAARIERSRLLAGLLSRDGLTRLLTHSAFLERARAAFARARRPRARPVIWVMIDLDHFKSINDRFGHLVGDRVLASLSSLLRRRLRPSDTVGRYGGEEFAILLEDLSLEEAERLVNRLRADWASTELHNTEGGSFHATLSAGLAALDPRMGLDSWRDAADRALYAAKSEGRNRVALASPPRAGAENPVA
jgi:diguanylate cyclase (GGDEF)-like protein